MMTLIALPIIRNDADLEDACVRLDIIIDASDGSPEADERTALSDLIAAYEDRHPDFLPGGPLAVVRRLMDSNELSQRDLPEIGAQSVVSEVLQGKRPINARMAAGLAKRFGLPVGAFIVAQ